MSGPPGPPSVELFELPLHLLGHPPFSLEVAAAVAGVSAGAAVLHRVFRRRTRSDVGLHLWVVPAAVALLATVGLFLGRSWYCTDGRLGLALGWLSPFLVLTVLLALRVRGRSPSLAGWLVVPTLAMIAVGFDLYLALPNSDYWRIPSESEHYLYWRYREVFLFATMGLFLVGATMAASAFSPSARSRGHDRFLATRGALLIGFAGLLECHHGIIAAWFLNDFHHAAVAWDLRNRLLLGIAAIALLSLVSNWRSRNNRQETQLKCRAATVLSALQLVILAICLFALDRSAGKVFGVPGLLRAEPICAMPPCTTENALSPHGVPIVRYPSFATDLGYVQVRYLELDELDPRGGDQRPGGSSLKCANGIGERQPAPD